MSFPFALSVLFGSLVGLLLGLTGGGGAIFAVPLLVYGLGVSPSEGVGVSLLAVGAGSLVGFLDRWRVGLVETRTGLLFAAAGILGAPLGTWIALRVPDSLLLLMFAGLMIVIAVRMWSVASEPETCGTCGVEGTGGPTCARDEKERLILTTRCAVVLLLVGLGTGALSGLFGVGGGFVIVPALVLFSRMSIHRAVGTSLMVISLVSVSGITAHVIAGRPIPPVVAAPFLAGAIAGLFAGGRLSQRFSGPTLQRVFAVAIVAVATFVIVRNLKPSR